MSAGELIAALEGVVGPSHVLTDRDLRLGYGTDWTGSRVHLPRLVVRPANAAEVAAVLRVCRDDSVPVVPQGGNTGLVGGSIPQHDESAVVLSCQRLTDLGQVDVTSGHVTVGAGCTVAAVQRHAASAGWTYGVDLASRESATLGGTVATDAGGLRVCRYGTTAAQVLGLEFALTDGSTVSRMSGLLKDGAGYRLPQLLVGSEGTLGVITGVRVRLHPREPQGTPVLVGCASVSQAQRVLAEVSATRVLQLAELLDQPSLTLVSEVCGLPSRPLDQHWPYYLLLQVRPDPDPIPDLDGAQLDAAGDERLLAYRERVTEALATLPEVHKMDVALPPAAIEDFLAVLAPACAPACPYVFGHLAEANLHLNLAGETGVDGLRRVAELVARHGGSIASEHGVGAVKSGLLPLVRSEADLALMRRIKQSFDPDGVLNPGVVLPVP